jgi:hypothetical protein
MDITMNYFFHRNFPLSYKKDIVYSLKRQPLVWQAWTEYCPVVHAEEYAKFKPTSNAQLPMKKRFSFQWILNYPSEYWKFEAKWKEEHPELYAVYITKWINRFANKYTNTKKRNKSSGGGILTRKLRR